MQNVQPVTMETDMYHSGCLKHWLVDTVECDSHGCRPKLKWKPLLRANAGSIEQRARQVEKQTDRKMRRLTENDRMIEKGEKAREQGGKGFRINSGKPLSISLCGDECLTGVRRAEQRLIDADLCRLPHSKTLAGRQFSVFGNYFIYNVLCFLTPALWTRRIHPSFPVS